MKKEEKKKLNKIKVEDNSGDKSYFTIIPNYIANHSTANDQALYLQMKKFAGEKGRCFATEETLMKKLRIGKKAYNNSLKYLIGKGWISYVGLTRGKTRPIKTYKVNDIWRLNSDHYKKIPSKRNLSSNEEISSESKVDTSQKQTKISLQRTVEEEPVLIRKNKKEIISKEMGKNSYGNSEINELISFLEEKLGGSLDGFQKENRRFAYLLIKKIRKDYPNTNVVEVIYQIIEAGMEDDFHARNLTNFRYIYYNTQRIIQSLRVRINDPKCITI